ncbi:hypothetical protein CRM91_13280 [Burkholderia ambifaria]|jgi:hypothetical protein|nr:hypothetical protein CRM91_13280 [Burkholderia ambifaria]PRG06352.1 hypothetical protein C6Q14_11585 [Burkholderia ambifaria]
MRRSARSDARPNSADARETDMTKREDEIADLSKELLGRIVQGAMMSGAPVDAQQCAALAVRCATALVDRLEARSG